MCLRFATVPQDETPNLNEPGGSGSSGGMDLLEELRIAGISAGLHSLGVCDASILLRARAELLRRRSLGLSDTMQFTYRNPERSTDPSRTLHDARSVIVGALSYASAQDVDASPSTESKPPAEENSITGARIARYAQFDYYAALRDGLERVADALRRAGHDAVVVADENNLVDREVAWKAGLGWFGKNANLLLPGAGSWFVLGSIVTNAALTAASAPVGDGCGSCRRCVDACPTGAIVADGVIDAGKCLAWLLQKPGVFPIEFREDLGNRLYGCDDCQDSCPITVRLGSRHSSPTSLPGALGSFVDVIEVLLSDDADLMRRFGRWYIPERDPRWVRRNALIILGNVARIPLDSRVETVLETYARGDDPYLRAHALWAAQRLGCDRVVTALAQDSDPVVAAERERLAEVLPRTADNGSLSVGAEDFGPKD